MDLSKIKQIKETPLSDMAEQYMAEGWVLLAILPANRSDLYACYILGNTDPKPEKQPARRFFDEDCDCSGGWITYNDDQGYATSARCPVCMAKYDQELPF